MAIRPASLLSGLRARLSVNRPLAVLLSITTVLTSMNVVVGADQPAENGALERVRARGAQAALTRDGAGTIVPRRLADAEEADIAAKIAETLENGRRNEIFRITNDFRVTLTAKGRAFAEEAVAEMSHGCAAATSVGADWTGFQISVEQTCSDAEIEEKFGVDLDERPGTEPGTVPPDAEATSGRAPAEVMAAGLGPQVPRGAGADSAPINSDDFNCFLAIGAGIWAMRDIILTVWNLTWLGWFLFTLTYALIGVFFAAVVIAIVLNCTNLIEAKARQQVWVAHEPLQLPIAALGPAGGTVEVGPNAVWTYPVNYCWRNYYYNYRWSYSTGQSVPASVRWSCP